MISDNDFHIICEQHRMSMPKEIYLCETEDEILWCEDDTTDYGSGVRYIRSDLVEALKAELADMKAVNAKRNPPELPELGQEFYYKRGREWVLAVMVKDSIFDRLLVQDSYTGRQRATSIIGDWFPVAPQLLGDGEPQ